MLTRIVDGLEERGYVTRRPDLVDRRRSVVTLTQAGRDLLLANCKRRDEWLAVRIAELETSDRDVLRRAIAILEKLNHE